MQLDTVSDWCWTGHSQFVNVPFFVRSDIGKSANSRSDIDRVYKVNQENFMNLQEMCLIEPRTKLATDC